MASPIIFHTVRSCVPQHSVLPAPFQCFTGRNHTFGLIFTATTHNTQSHLVPRTSGAAVISAVYLILFVRLLPKPYVAIVSRSLSPALSLNEWCCRCCWVFSRHFSFHCFDNKLCKYFEKFHHITQDVADYKHVLCACGRVSSKVYSLIVENAEMRKEHRAHIY